MRRLLPPGWLAYYRCYRADLALVDRSQVVLFADPQVLPDYPHRHLPGNRPASAKDMPAVSLIATLRNEATSAPVWLNSVLQQTRLPDEIILCDGGSTDGTLDILRDMQGSFPVPLRLIEAPGANIARGRNLAIAAASHPLVAITDFGVRLEQTWLAELVHPFALDPEVQLSAGYYRVDAANAVERLARHYLGMNLTQVNPQTFLPSSRSLALRKSLWTAAGGYPEWLSDAGEDTLFDYRLKHQPARWAFVPAAQVIWQAPGTLMKLVQTYWRYARGDGQAGLHARQYWYRTVLTLQLGMRLLLAVVLILAAFLLLGEWAWLPLTLAAAWLLVSFYQRNRRIAQALGLPFYPVTLMDELVGMAQVAGYARGVREQPEIQQREIEVYRRQLDEIVAAHPNAREVIVYPATHDWGFMFQRPHQMARAFARQGVLFFYGTQNELTDSVYGFREVEPNLIVFHVPLETFSRLAAPLVYIGSPWHREKLAAFQQPRLIYDHYDDLAVSGGRPEDHRWLLENARLAITTSRLLLDEAIKIRPDTLFLPNGVDYDWIQQARPDGGSPPPDDLAPWLATGRPLIGYSGALAEWFDYTLLAAAAQARPDWDFLLIGVNYDGSLLNSGLLELPNLGWLGMKAYHELFAYVWRFDVATIPFKVNAITLATSPIKMFEYMACGKPVVATDLPECRRTPGILIAKHADEFIARVQQALDLRADTAYLDKIDAVARANTWQQRAGQVLTAVAAEQSDE
jgi:glycosyltransferase involved in cell wall biosynthesis